MHDSYPSKGGSPSKMFSGGSPTLTADPAKAGMMRSAKGSHKPKSTKIAGDASQGKRHQTPPGIKR
jgi:hypothetical protein